MTKDKEDNANKFRKNVFTRNSQTKCPFTVTFFSAEWHIFIIFILFNSNSERFNPSLL